MANTEFFVAPTGTLADASDDNGGGGRMTATGDVVYQLTGGGGAGGTVVGGSPNVITDLSGDDWDGAAIGDGLTWDPAGANEARVIVDINGDAATVNGGGMTAGADKTVKVGGCWETPQHAADMLTTSIVNAAGDPPRVNLYPATYSLGAALTFGADFTVNVPLKFRGTGGWSVGDGAVVTITDAVQANTILSYATDHVVHCGKDYIRTEWLRATGNSGMAKYGFNFPATAYGSGAYRCWAKDNGSTGIYLGGRGNYAAACEMSGWGAFATAYGLASMGDGTMARGNHVHGGTGQGLYVGYGYTGAASYNIVHGASSHGLMAYVGGPLADFLMEFDHCISYGNGGSGAYWNHATKAIAMNFINCILAENTGKDIASLGGDVLASLYGTAFYNDGIGSNVTVLHDGRTTLTADPFIDAASGDFRIKPGVMELLGQGFPQKFMTSGALQGAGIATLVAPGIG